jgi:hypothetical protein
VGPGPAFVYTRRPAPPTRNRHLPALYLCTAQISFVGPLPHNPEPHRSSAAAAPAASAFARPFDALQAICLPRVYVILPYPHA